MSRSPIELDLEQIPMFLPSTAESRISLPTWKRMIDLIGVSVAFPVFAVSTFLVAIVIKLTSPGPIFFRQHRLGYKGQTFLIYKFRTMRLDAEIQSHQAHMRTLLKSNQPMQKMDGHRDPRLIPGGWLMRASGLDELPQIVNVFRGEMSLVGPRPCLAYEFEEYTPEQRRRCNAVPGLTGLWQVSGKNRTTFDTMVRLDIEYAERKSLWLDLRIIVLTIPVVAQQVLDIGLQRIRSARRTPSARVTVG